MALANVCGFQLQTKQNINDIPAVYPSRSGGSIVPNNEQTVQNFQMPVNWDVSTKTTNSSHPHVSILQPAIFTATLTYSFEDIDISSHIFFLSAVCRYMQKSNSDVNCNIFSLFRV